MLVKAEAVAGKRWDNGYHGFKQGISLELLGKKSDLECLGDIILDGSYGILTPGDVYSPENPITYVRVTDMRPHMRVAIEESLRVPEEYFRHTRARIRKYDVLLAVKGASIASDKSVAFVEDIDTNAIVNGTIFRFQVKPEHNPFYVAIMLDSHILKDQIRNIQISNNAVAYVDKPSICALRMPLPLRKVQDHIALIMRDAYAARLSKLSEAERVLAQIESLVLNLLGVDLLEQHGDKNALTGIQKLAGGRFDFEAVVTARESNYDGLKSLPLRAVVTHIDERITPAVDCPRADVNFVGLSNIASNLGEIIGFAPSKGSSVLSSSPKFQEGDILFGRMRPYLNKIAIAPFDGICSGEIAVFRADPTKVVSSFLHALLLSRLTLQQITPLQRGTSLPRVYPSDILNIKLPIPDDLELQGKIAEEVTSRRIKSNKLRLDAEAAVVEAKSRIERMVLGEQG